MAKPPYADRYAQGMKGEYEIAEWLRGQGFSVLMAPPVEKGVRKGPRLHHPDGDLVVPDITAFSDRKVTWVEAKDKKGWAYFRKKQTPTAGIDSAYWYDYLKIDEFLPWPVWILFLFKEQRWADIAEPPEGLQAPKAGLYGARLEVLKPTVLPEHKGMVYWAEEDLPYLRKYPLLKMQEPPV